MLTCLISDIPVYRFFNQVPEAILAHLEQLNDGNCLQGFLGVRPVFPVDPEPSAMANTSG